MKPFQSLVLVSLLSLCAWGQSQAPLTWEDCLRAAAQHNPDLLSALRAQEASRAQYLGSYNGILPQLNLTNSYTDSSATSVGLLADGTVGTVTSASKNWRAQGSASLDLLDLTQWAAIRSFAAASRQAQAAYAQASATLLLNLYKAFSALLYAQEQIGVTQSIRNLWNQNAQMIGLRYDSGAESKGNNMRTQAEFLQADVALTQAGRDAQVAKEQLAQAMGTDDFSVLIVTGTWSTAPAPVTPPNFSELLNALPAVRVQQAVVDQAKAGVSSARSVLYPKLSLQYNRGYQDRTEFPTSNPYWTFTGLLSYPLFGGGPTSAYYNTTAALRTYEKSLQDLRSAQDQARTTLQTAWSNYAQAQDQVRVQRAFLDAAIQRKQESDIMYQSGLMSFQDWELIMNDYVNFQKSYLTSEQNLIAAEGQWRFATGQQLGA